MTHLGGSIDEFNVNLFQGSSGDLGDERLSQHDDSLLGTDDASLDHDEIVSDHTVVGETSHGSDVLFSQIGVGGGVVLDSGAGGLSDSVDLLVHLGSMVVAQLTGSGDRESDSSGMPRSDATNFSVTSV